MSVKIGVWIDHKQAILVLVTNTGKEIKKIASGIKKPVRSVFVAEDTLERKSDSQLKNFYDEVIACLQGAEALLILGPGEAKGEFHKRLKSKKLRDLIVELERADQMTDRQLAAKVAEHFATIPAKNSVSPKKTAKMKTARTNSEKPTKKVGK